MTQRVDGGPVHPWYEPFTEGLEEGCGCLLWVMGLALAGAVVIVVIAAIVAIVQAVGA